MSIPQFDQAELLKNPPVCKPLHQVVCPAIASSSTSPIDEKQLKDYLTLSGALAAALGTSRLEPVITNAHKHRTVQAAIRARDWERNHFAARSRPQGGTDFVRLSAWSRSWYSDTGRKHWANELTRRAKVMNELAESSSELPKHITLTYARADVGWIDQGAIRRFMNAFRTHTRRLGYVVDYMWFAETQDRGALHYHLVVIGCPFLQKKLLERWWGHGFVDIRARSTVDSLKDMLSYARKGIGRAELSDQVRHLMHSAFKLRRFGCSRRIGAALELIPRWLQEYAELVGVDVDELTWELDTDKTKAYVWWGDTLLTTFRYRSVKWRILTELLSSQTQLTT